MSKEEYEKGFEDGRAHAIKYLCRMVENVLNGGRGYMDPKLPHSATFERLMAVLDGRIH